MKTLATGLLVLLSLLVAENSNAQQSINSPPDTIYYNGKIITVDPGFTIAQAFAVRVSIPAIPISRSRRSRSPIPIDPDQYGAVC